MHYKNEGTYSIPGFKQISEESKLTGVPIQTLYEEHIEDFMRYYAVPTELDTIPNKKLKY